MKKLYRVTAYQAIEWECYVLAETAEAAKADADELLESALRSEWETVDDGLSAMEVRPEKVDATAMVWTGGPDGDWVQVAQ